MGRIGHLSQIWLYGEESTYRRVIETLIQQRPEMSRVFADPAVLQQVREFEMNQIDELGGFAENTDENMERLALIDPLTSVYNGRSFLKELDSTLKHAWRYNRLASLAMVAIDGFEDIIQQYGQVTSSAIQRICANAIQRTIGQGDVVARYSTTDFAVVMPNKGTAAATMLAETIREVIATQVITHNWINVPITASLGISTYPVHAYDRDEVISIAMQALYVSKSRGGDRVCTI